MELGGAVKRPVVLMIHEGVTISDDLNAHLSCIEYIDTIDNEVDGLTVTFSKMFLPPQAGDKLLVSIGFGLDLTYIGEFYVTGWNEGFMDGTMKLKLTPIAYSKKLKEKRTGSYDKVTLEQILKEVAGRHDLKVKNDLKKVSYVHKAQTNESDLVFMHRLARENNATFSIKNGTIIFKPKSLSADKALLPTVLLSMGDLVDGDIDYQDKTEYLSAEAKFQKTKKNKIVTVKVGKGEPKLVLEGNFKNEADAKAKLVAALERENAGRVRGWCSVTTQEVIAGAMLTLDLGYKVESDLQITEVRHRIDESGYVKDVTFTK